MIYTNDLNLPPAVVAAVNSDEYDAGGADISVTGLIGPPRMRIMNQKHGHEAKIDVSRRLFALLGTAMHKLMEHGDDPSDIVKEERIFSEHMGWSISGQIDRAESGAQGVTIYDYKLAAARAVVDEKAEWSQQLNLYRWLYAQEYGHWPKAKIIVIIRDWIAAKAREVEGYPQTPMVVIPVPSWPEIKIMSYLSRRVQLHQDAQALFDRTGEIVHCTSEDRWARADVWAARTVRRKAALSLHPTREAAEKVSGMDHVEYRPGVQVRCEDWCQFKDFCEQFKAIKEQQEMTQMETQIE